MIASIVDATESLIKQTFKDLSRVYPGREFITHVRNDVTRFYLVEEACMVKKQEVPHPPGTITADVVIAKFIETRDKLAEMEKEFKNACEPLNEVQEKRAAWLKGQADTLGVESLRSSAGTCFIDWKDSATVADREVFFEWVKENNKFEFLESRVSKAAVKQYIEDGAEPSNDGEEATPVLPPGITYAKFKDVKIRRR